MERWSRWWNRLFWMIFFCTGLYILIVGGHRLTDDSPGNIFRRGKESVQRICQREFARCLYPGLFFEYEEGGEAESLAGRYIQRVMEMHPLYKLQYSAVKKTVLENAATYEMLISGGIHDESENEENMEALARAENSQKLEQKRAKEKQEELERQRMEHLAEAQMTGVISEPVTAGTIYSLEELADFEFLFSHFYTMESNTTISPSELNAEKLLSRDMSIDKNTGGPQILIYHTHSQEGFVDSVPGDNSTTIVGVGARLAKLLREKGYDVLHVTSVYDLVNGKLDRNDAYTKAYQEISQILENTPSIQAVIDLHRDGVQEGTRLVQEVNGKTCARFMFFNGLSRTKKNGAIDYLYNPYIQDNLAMTLQLKLMCEQYYPGLSRNIYLKSLRYNLHLSDKAILIEAGAQTNTLQEMLNTMEPLSDVLDKVFDP